ncbi:hypothetical protein HX045_02160 [Myroides odoratimimus]|uniref:hypothetical protein n=1 Tax=Myroides odoratimimus TaxID=76832 RepID=UPI000AE36FF9|nr:hypothetical protein [Myroides odoratimimus]MCA4805166.1 hypothetical protein [Myroides odoratimimus]MCO7721918.1 hypothetical protein [Myroides odoratimimus]MDM1036736.1 hypothetical protein [Myroides odoratimimus]MDM1050627.1 hypothetical protein [Myroides odoratimimus]MDM1442041.1 hypothetical protein [Myroides odoratimimus]
MGVSMKERELINEINHDENLLDLVIRYVKDLKKVEVESPCQYTVEEVKERIQIGMESLERGEYKSQNDMRSKYSI